LVPALPIQLAKCKAQLEGRTVEMQQYRFSSIRMSDEHARELTRVRQEHKRAQEDSHQTITELRQLLAALGKRNEALVALGVEVRPLISFEKLVASKFFGYETKLGGAAEHQTDRWLRPAIRIFCGANPKAWEF
jgi:hypothetical protein